MSRSPVQVRWVAHFMSKSFDQLVQIMSKLRGPGGCPWDHEQTHQSLTKFLIEETYEVISAIDNNNMPHLCEELGDLLLQIVFHAQMASERGDFTIEDVSKEISEKLIRRHPHVFADTKVKDASEVVKNWNKIKAQEKSNKTQESLLSSVPGQLPALMQAYKLSKRAGRVGFDWKEPKEVLPKIEEELNELKEAVQKKDPAEIEHEFGDILFALTNLARHLNIDAEESLRQSNNRFRERFATMEELIKRDNKKMEELTPEQWEVYWQKAKQKD